MKQLSALVLFGTCALALSGCANRYNASAPPPPPPYSVPPLIQVAGENGFHAGEADGVRDVRERRPYRARSTRAYYDTPGYQPNLGPFGPYQNAFRNAYLRGYEQGFRHG